MRRTNNNDIRMYNNGLNLLHDGYKSFMSIMQTIHNNSQLSDVTLTISLQYTQSVGPGESQRECNQALFGGRDVRGVGQVP